MAKSIRSKWKRKMRAVKRERYGKKELDRLKKTLGIKEGDGASTSTTVTAGDAVDISDVVTITTKEEILQKQREENEGTGMEVDVAGRKFNSKTLRDQNGTYPIWVHPRKIRRQKASKKMQQKKGKTKNKKR